MAFAIAGTACRLYLLAVPTRLQIIAFIALAFAVQTVGPGAPGSPTRRASFILNAAAATVAITITKFAVEGLPHYLR